MNTLKSLTISFTGHRPNVLPWEYDGSSRECKKFKKDLEKILEKAINLGYTNFICGMALGSDTICAEVVLKLRKKYKQIKLECAIPCLNQSVKWTNEAKIKYDKILKQSNKVTFITNENYTFDCMQKRNKYLVDNCDILIAIYSGKKGGTQNTISYAHRIGKLVKIINPYEIN